MKVSALELVCTLHPRVARDRRRIPQGYYVLQLQARDIGWVVKRKKNMETYLRKSARLLDSSGLEKARNNELAKAD